MSDPAWVEHAIWWQIYPLGFVGAFPADPPPTADEHRLRRVAEWFDHALELGASGIALGPVFASQTHGGAVDSIYLAGSIARHPGAAEHISRMLGMPVRILNPWTLPGSNPDDVIEPPAGMAVAAGLALRDLARRAGN